MGPWNPIYLFWNKPTKQPDFLLIISSNTGQTKNPLIAVYEGKILLSWIQNTAK